MGDGRGVTGPAGMGEQAGEEPGQARVSAKRKAAGRAGGNYGDMLHDRVANGSAEPFGSPTPAKSITPTTPRNPSQFPSQTWMASQLPIAPETFPCPGTLRSHEQPGR